MSTTSADPSTDTRTLGLFAATGVGVGAIVGGGVLALAGVAFATTGPSAILAFALNGLIALLTALTFAEMATAFPESGGTYTFAKKVLSVEAAFMVGWVVLFASVVAAVLYALGFATFARILVVELYVEAGATAPLWLTGRGFETVAAVVSILLYALILARSSGGGGQWETVGKVVVFAALIVAGLWVLRSQGVAAAGERLTPFFSSGAGGLFQAMGYSFIALQGFDLIAALGGEVKNPRRVLPRAMLGSLLVALVIYLPLLTLVATVGVAPGSTVTEVAKASPEALVAVAAEQYLGRTGFWLVVVAALLSMLSALQANLLAASYIALAMARDRNLPAPLGTVRPDTGAPAVAVAFTAAAVVLTLAAVPDLSAAGAVSSLIFLLSFTLAHAMGILARRRGGGREDGLRLPFFPAVQVLGGAACLGLAVFQGVVVPSAGFIAAVWLGAGGVLYFTVFSRRAKVADAAAEALDPALAQSRGRNPLVLVPIANPASAPSLVQLAHALAPPVVGNVLLLSVVKNPATWRAGDMPPQLTYAQEVLGKSLCTSFEAGYRPQALTTVADQPWQEIARVARIYPCESLLLGLGDLGSEEVKRRAAPKEESLEWLLNEVPSDVVLLGAPEDWRLSDVRRVLVPVGGRRDQSHLRARLVGSLCRTYQELEVTYLGIATPGMDGEPLRETLQELADDEAPGSSRPEVVVSDAVADAIVDSARQVDLVILGLRREKARRKALGRIPIRVSREAGTAVLLIGAH